MMMKTKRYISSIIPALAILLQPINASAYKVGTHMWIAQQVLNDVLPDGKVTIGPWECRVDGDILSALRAYQNEYRMGSVGPDGFPDLIVPQVTTHPGVAGAWQTDDWLRWLLSNARTDQEKAFVYGYVGHAASDVFAHTYVNMYSGDLFLLTDRELENEYRHFALESYIEKHAPPLLDFSGNPLGNNFDNLSAPSRFLADSLILNETVANQYLRVYEKTASHLVGMWKVRSALDRAIKISDVGVGSVIDFNPLRQNLMSWRQDVDKAVVAYVEASGNAVRELMKSGGNPLKPILYWKACWGPVFLAVPRQIPQAACSSAHDLMVINSELDSLRASLGPLTLVVDPLGEIERFVNGELREALIEASNEIARNVGGNDAETLLRIINEGIDAEKLNQIFSRDSSGKGLLEIPNIASQVDADMNLTTQGYFDPMRFHSMYNSIVLTKLTLLRAPQLNQLIRDAGVKGPTVYGKELYSNSPNPFNILLEAVRSVDGNHQWMGLAPPYPRRPGFKDTGWPNQRHYGYEFSNNTKGFRLWWDPQVREKVFNRIFLGQLALGGKESSDVPSHLP